MPMKPRIFKLARRIVLFLLLGAIINVGVAWGCALTWGAYGTRTGVSAKPVDGLDEYTLLLDTGIPFRTLRGLEDEWVEFDGKTVTRHHMEFGVWVIAVSKATARGGKLRLPFLPLPLGFAINTIFYAAALWLLFAFPFVLRRRRRIKRGLCPACAYPVGDSAVCTECGKNVNPALRMAR